MVYKTNLETRNKSFQTGAGFKQQETFYARVIDIVLDETHPDYDRFGKIDALYGIRFMPFSNDQSTEDTDKLPFAYYYKRDLISIPLKNEVVAIHLAPTFDIEENGYKGRFYYSEAVNLWNSSNHNAIPDLMKDSSKVDLGSDIAEADHIPLLRPNPGDVLLQGRAGNSIRLSSFKEGKLVPSITIRNSVRDTTDTFIPNEENEEQDGTFLKITKGTVGIGSTKLKPIPKNITDYAPKDLNSYSTHQAIASSGRVVLIAKEDSIVLLGKKGIIKQAPIICNRAEESYSVIAPKVYLGDTTGIQPVLKGDDLISSVNELLNYLDTVAIKFTSVVTPLNAVAVINQVGVSMRSKLRVIKTKLENSKSKVTYTA